MVLSTLVVHWEFIQMKKGVVLHRVLLVDDDTDTLLEAKEAFERKGFKINTAHNVDEAYALLVNKMELGIRFTAIMSDFDLEGTASENGLKLLKKIREDKAFHDVLFILYTAHGAGEENIGKILSADKRATHFLKPKDMNKVIIPFILAEISCNKY